MRWREKDFDLGVYGGLSAQEIYDQTHQALSDKGLVSLSPTEAVARAVAIYCAMTGKFGRFGYHFVPAKTEEWEVVERVREKIAEGTGVTLFHIPSNDPPNGDGERAYLSHEVATANAVGLLRQNALENQKKMSACDKFFRYSNQLSHRPSHVAPWQTGQLFREYLQPLLNDARKLFWLVELGAPPPISKSSNPTFLGVMGAMKTACLKLTEQFVRGIDTKGERFCYVATMTPSDMTVSALDLNCPLWRSERGLDSITEINHKQSALVAIICAYTFAHPAFRQGDLANQIAAWQTSMRAWDKDWVEWQSEYSKKRAALQKDGSEQPKPEDEISYKNRKAIQKLEGTTQRNAGLLEYIKFAEFLSDKYLLPVLAISDCTDNYHSRSQWSQYLVGAAAFRDVAKMYEHINNGDMEEDNAPVSIAAFLFYLCELQKLKVLRIYLDKEALGRGPLQIPDNKGSQYFPGATFGDVRLMIRHVGGGLPQPQGGHLLTDIVRSPPTWLSDYAKDNEKLASILAVAMGKQWSEVTTNVSLPLTKKAKGATKQRKKKKNKQSSEKTSGGGPAGSAVIGNKVARTNRDAKKVTPDKDDNADGVRLAAGTPGLDERLEQVGFYKGTANNSSPPLSGSKKSPAACDGNPELTSHPNSPGRNTSEGEKIASTAVGGRVNARRQGDECTMYDPAKKEWYSEQQATKALRDALSAPRSVDRFQQKQVDDRRQEAIFRCNHFVEDEEGRYQNRECCLSYYDKCDSLEPTGQNMCLYCRGPLHSNKDRGCGSTLDAEAGTAEMCSPLGQSGDDCISVNNRWQIEKNSQDPLRVNHDWPPPHPLRFSRALKGGGSLSPWHSPVNAGGGDGGKMKKGGGSGERDSPTGEPDSAAASVAGAAPTNPSLIVPPPPDYDSSCGGHNLGSDKNTGSGDNSGRGGGYEAEKESGVNLSKGSQSPESTSHDTITANGLQARQKTMGYQSGETVDSEGEDMYGPNPSKIPAMCGTGIAAGRKQTVDAHDDLGGSDTNAASTDKHVPLDGGSSKSQDSPNDEDGEFPSNGR